MWLLSFCLQLLIFDLLFQSFRSVAASGICRRVNTYTSRNYKTFYECPAPDYGYFISNFSVWKLAKQVLVDEFPIDPEKRNFVREVKDCIFSEVKPIPFRSEVALVASSAKVLNDILDLDISVTNQSSFISFVSGASILRGTRPLSHRYGGHQFGSWADQLGDGRAVMIGEYVNSKGERWELQLKGSGLTPYSRRGDGRAVLRSSIREFLCSEAMYRLGIPTSRAASIVVSDDPVIRDQFYDGHPIKERGAVVLRLAKSWFRIGSLEILTVKKEIKLLRKLTDFVIKNYFPSIDVHDKNKYLEFYSVVVRQTAEMIALWQSVGFAHGVCNTDNFSLLSITIDYGPFGFMEDYDPDLIPNTSDDEGMYSYKNQPEIGIFNLDKLGQALVPLLTQGQIKEIEAILKGYVNIYKSKYMEIFRKKLGFVTVEEDDEQLVAILLKMMEVKRSDFTLTFRQLGETSLKDLEREKLPKKAWALKKLSTHEWYDRWVRVYQDRQARQKIKDKDRQALMNSINPRYVLRNWIAQDVIGQAENNNFEGVRKVLKILENPYTVQKEAEESGYASPPPYWAKSLKVSCSS